MTTRTLTDAEIKQWKYKLEGMSHEELARLHRFSPVGHVVFDSSLPLYDVFDKLFKSFGGMTPEISKLIGW